MSTTRPFPYVRPGATAAVAGPAAALALTLALTGCTADRNNSAAPATASSRASSPASSSKASPASDRTQYLPGESVTKAPDLPDGKVVARTANAHGNAEIDVPGGIGPGSLSIAVNCEGRGTLNVSVDPTGLSFPLTCAAGKVSGILNRLDRRHADSHAHATVTVTASTGIRWSLTVGR